MISFCEINLVWEFEVWGWNTSHLMNVDAIYF
jgi:hypothetical protein